jgi:hypothetical protein
MWRGERTHLGDASEKFCRREDVPWQAIQRPPLRCIKPEPTHPACKTSRPPGVQAPAPTTGTKRPAHVSRFAIPPRRMPLSPPCLVQPRGQQAHTARLPCRPCTTLHRCMPFSVQSDDAWRGPCNPKQHEILRGSNHSACNKSGYARPYVVTRVGRGLPPGLRPTVWWRVVHEFCRSRTASGSAVTHVTCTLLHGGVGVPRFGF